MPKTFVMTGIGGVWNYGCEAIVRSTAKILRSVYPTCVVKLICPTRDYGSKALADTDITLVPVRRRYGIPRCP